MESLKNIEENKFTQFDINVLLQNSLNKTWESFVCDEVLLNEIDKYLSSNWVLRKAVKSQILSRFLNNSNDKIDTSKPDWIAEFNNFFDLLWNESWKSKEELSENLSLNLFRSKENLKKLNYIKEHSDITDDIILIAKNLSENNPYHNFWHEIGVAETVVKLCEEWNIDRKTLNLLVLAALFHDAWYTKKYEIDLEKLACNLSDVYIPDVVFEKLNLHRDDLKKLIMMTKINNRAKNNEDFVKILQDADLWWLWQWPYYILYSCMGMVDEWFITLDNFIEDERTFIKNNIIEWKLFLSNAWQVALKDPFESLDIISWWPKWVIEKAYQLRDKNISFDDFKQEIDKIINA